MAKIAHFINLTFGAGSSARNTKRFRNSSQERIVKVENESRGRPPAHTGGD